MQFLFQPNKLHFNKKNPLLLGLEPGLPAEQVLLAIVKSLFFCVIETIIFYGIIVVIISFWMTGIVHPAKKVMYTCTTWKWCKSYTCKYPMKAFFLSRKKKRSYISGWCVYSSANCEKCCHMLCDMSLILEEAIICIFNPHTTNYLHFSRCFLRAEILETKAIFFNHKIWITLQ